MFEKIFLQFAVKCKKCVNAISDFDFLRDRKSKCANNIYNVRKLEGDVRLHRRAGERKKISCKLKNQISSSQNALRVLFLIVFKKNDDKFDEKKNVFFFVVLQ